MALKDLFTMAKADKYTADGREELNKAREADVEDKTYNIGEISEKTGLQKTANGWRPPKKGGTKALKETDRKAYNKAVKNISTERLQEAFNKREGKELTPEAKAKHEIIKAELESRRDKADAEVGLHEGEEDFEKSVSSENKAKFDEYGLPSNETIAMKDEFLKQEKISDPSKLTNAEFNDLAQKLDKKLGINNLERSQELLVATPDEENASNPYEMTESEKNQAMKDPKTRLSQKYDAVKKAQKGSPEYDKAMTEYLKERDIFKQEQGADAVKEFPVTPESKPASNSEYWKKRAKGERTATLVDWLDDWDKNPEEKSETAYKEIEEELKSRGVTRQNRASAKEADNKGRNDFYRRAYEGDAAPKDAAYTAQSVNAPREKLERILTGDTKIRVRR